MPETTDTKTDTTTDAPAKPAPVKPAEAEPKQRPVKRPPKPAYSVPRGVAFLDESGELVRYGADATIEDGIVPDELVDYYLKRGDLIALTD